MLPGNYLAEVNNTNKLSDMKEQLQRIGIKTESFPSVLTSEWENHAPSMVSTSQAFPTTTNIFLKSMDLIDLKYLDHETEQQDMAATCMVVLPDMTDDEENHYQQFQSPNHLPDCALGHQSTMSNGTSLNKSLRQYWSNNPITYEESKYQSLVIFSGDIFPLHFYQWRKKVLHFIQGIPVAK